VSRRTRVAAEAIASAVILAALLWLSDPRKIWDTLSGADGSWVLGAIVVNTLTVPLMAFRWKLLLSAKGIHDVSTAWLTRTYFVALFAGQFLPAAIGGDAVRAVELGRRTHDAPEAVASVLIDRLVGVVSLVGLAVVAYAAGGHSAGGIEVLIAEAVFGVAAAVAKMELVVTSSRPRALTSMTMTKISVTWTTTASANTAPSVARCSR